MEHPRESSPQDEGLFWHRHDVSFTYLLSWDRSADHRFNCAASFIVDAIVTPGLALEMARATFPAVFARIEGHIGRSVELAGPVPSEAP